jgi:hypothetical protein
MTPPSTAHRRRLGVALMTTAIVALAGGVFAYLHDPPWVAGMTTGFRGWEVEAPGIPFRWAAGHATFFVPSGATQMTLPLRSQFPGPNGEPVTVNVRVDDRVVTNIVLDDPGIWVRPILALPSRETHRRFRRVDLRVSRTVGDLILGVQVGEIVLEGGTRVR